MIFPREEISGGMFLRRRKRQDNGSVKPFFKYMMSGRAENAGAYTSDGYGWREYVRGTCLLGKPPEEMDLDFFERKFDADESGDKETEKKTDSPRIGNIVLPCEISRLGAFFVGDDNFACAEFVRVADSFANSGRKVLFVNDSSDIFYSAERSVRNDEKKPDFADSPNPWDFKTVIEGAFGSGGRKKTVFDISASCSNDSDESRLSFASFVEMLVLHIFEMKPSGKKKNSTPPAVFIRFACAERFDRTFFETLETLAALCEMRDMPLFIMTRTIKGNMKNIFELFKNRAVFSVADSSTCVFLSEHIGEAEAGKLLVGGASHENLREVRTRWRVVLPEEIRDMPPGRFIFRIGGGEWNGAWIRGMVPEETEPSVSTKEDKK